MSPNVGCFPQTPPGSWALPLCALAALVQTSITTALSEHCKHLSPCLSFFSVCIPPPGLTEGLGQKKNVFHECLMNENQMDLG